MAIREERGERILDPMSDLMNSIASILADLIQLILMPLIQLTEALFSIVYAFLPIFLALGVIGIILQLLGWLNPFSKKKRYYHPSGYIYAKSDEEYLSKAFSIATTWSNPDFEEKDKTYEPVIICPLCKQINEDPKAFFCVKCGSQIQNIEENPYLMEIE